MFCSKCGAEIMDNSQFCAKCGKKISLELTETKVQASPPNQVSEEHVLAKAEISWAPLVSAIIWSAFFLALYFIVEAWWFEPRIRESAIRIAKQSDRFITLAEQELQITTILNFVRIPIIIIEVISVALNFLVRARQFLYVTNKRIVGNSGHIFGKRVLDLPLSQIRELRIEKAFSIIPHTSIYVNATYDFQIKEGQEFRLLAERLIREANPNKGASTSPPSLQHNRQEQLSSTSNRINANTWICGKCGADNSNSDSFCKDCGSYK